MPKFGVHHIVYDSTVASLAKSTSQAARVAATLLRNERDTGILGAIGPDLFAFAPSRRLVASLGPLALAIEMVPGVPSTLRVLTKTTEQTILATQPGLAIGLTGIGAWLQSLLPARSPRLAHLALNIQDYGASSRPEPTRDSWFNLLHYSKTGDFARCLVDAARSPRQKAFAYGYLTHIATDVIGHAYVNTLVGGPYRLHSQRHMLIENMLDSWCYWDYYRLDVNTALTTGLGLTPATLSDDITQLITHALLSTYEPAALASHAKHTEVRQTLHIALGLFLLFLKALRRSVPDDDSTWRTHDERHPAQSMPPQSLFRQLYGDARERLVRQGLMPPPPDPRSSLDGLAARAGIALGAPEACYPNTSSVLQSQHCRPDLGSELPYTMSGFALATLPPPGQILLSGQIPFDEAALVHYAHAKTPAETRQLAEAGHRIGTAADFAAWLIDTAADPRADADKRAVAFTNWNLDADRGYGYKTWTGAVTSGTVREERYADEAY